MMKRPKVKYTIAALLVFVLCAMLIFLAQKAEPMEEAYSAYAKDDNMLIIEDDDFITFQPKINDTNIGLIIYPGAKVDPKAYAPTAKAIAEQGIRTIIVKMPLNLAIMGANKADQVIERDAGIEKWYIAGHSLGGVMAARYTKNHLDVINGLILWAAYPEKSVDLSKATIPIMSIYGTNDGLTLPGDISDTQHLLPDTVQWVSISGGNHSQFGWYGFQKGDNQADISREEQQKEIVEATIELIKTGN